MQYLMAQWLETQKEERPESPDLLFESSNFLALFTNEP